jgi:rhodanese-related sulfurtransferase
MSHLSAILLVAALLLPMSQSLAETLKVGISRDMATLTVKHNGKDVVIQRNQNQDNRIAEAYAKTSRPCPPFCIQPARLAPGVETIAELEVLDYLKRMSNGDDSILVIDSRTPDWVKRGSIPGAINIPWTTLNVSQSDPFTVIEVLEKKFGVQVLEGLFDFSNAKTLVMFCNGMWCGQSPSNIRALLKIGYPADRIKWYRGGMQDWSALGLTTVTPE